MSKYMYTEKFILVEMVDSRRPTLGLYSNTLISVPTTSLKNEFFKGRLQKKIAITPP